MGKNMSNAAGLFVVFEGIDGCSRSTQIGKVAEAVRKWNKYQDVVFTGEPTWMADEIKTRLATETDPMSNSARLAWLFISDRGEHYFTDIRSDLERRRVVLCDRYAMSTLAYQSLPGEQTMLDLISAHFTANIGTPDITFYLALSAEEAARRMAARGDAREKFENVDFARKLAAQYEFIWREAQQEGAIKQLLGRVVKIDAAQEPRFVTADILRYLEPVYRARLNGKNEGDFCLPLE